MREEHFRTERVALRALESTDAGALQTYLNDPALLGRRYIPWGMADIAPLSLSRVEEILDSWAKEKKALTLGIELRETGELVGHTGWYWGWDTHCPSVWIAVATDHQRVGIGSDVLLLLLTHLFENTPAHNVNGWIAGWNDAGLAFARAHGFIETGRIPRCGIRDGAYYQEVMVDILKPEWLTERGRSYGA